MKAGYLLRAAWFHLTLPVRLSHWRFVIQRRTNEHHWRPCAELPDDILCILYRANLWTRPRRPSDMDTGQRVSIVFEVIERLSEGNSFVEAFCAENGLPIAFPDAGLAT